MSDKLTEFLDRPRSRRGTDKESKSKERKSTSKTGRSKPGRPPKPPKPPVRIEPGPFHELLAALGLKAVEAAAEKRGLKLDLGDTKKVDDYIRETAQSEDGPQPVEIASRVIAHVMHRLPGSRTVAKKLEGTDKKSGLFSDLGILAYSLILRNEDTLYQASEVAVTNFFSKENKAAPEEEPLMHMGDVHPMVVRNNHQQTEA